LWLASGALQVVWVTAVVAAQLSLGIEYRRVRKVLFMTPTALTSGYLSTAVLVVLCDTKPDPEIKAGLKSKSHMSDAQPGCKPVTQV
jgi:hypothetical protein